MTDLKIQPIDGLEPAPQAVRFAGGTQERMAAAAEAPAQIVIVPGVLWLTYNLDLANTSADIEVVLLGLQVNQLTGRLNWQAGQATLEDDLNLDYGAFHILDGALQIAVDGTGIKLSGSLKFLGGAVASVTNDYIVKW